MAKPLQRLLEVLESPKWDWRTITGLSADTGLPRDELLNLITDNPGLVIQSAVPSEDGEPLFASARGLMLKALEDERWDWRTVHGLAEATRLSEAVVRRFLAKNQDVVIKSDVPSVDGEELYTSAAHWDQRASITQKLRGALRNRRR